ncbi:hypothetical protein R6Q59_012835 [Mikania micrantha]
MAPLITKRYCPLVLISFNPPFIQPQEMGLTPGPENINVSKKFVFPNSRLNELKKKLAGGSVNNPTRFEVLASLLHKTLVESVTATSGRFKPSYLWFTVNMRDRLVPKLPQSNVGNLVKGMIVKTRHISEASLSLVTAEIRKDKQLLEGIQTMQDLLVQAFDYTHSKHTILCTRILLLKFSYVSIHYSKK